MEENPKGEEYPVTPNNHWIPAQIAQPFPTVEDALARLEDSPYDVEAGVALF